MCYMTLCITELNNFAQISVHWHNMLTYRTTLRHIVMPLLVSLQNGVRETTAEIPYRWRVTTQIWVTSAYDSLKPSSLAELPIRSSTQIWLAMRHQYGISADVPDVISQGNQWWWSCKMLAVFSGFTTSNLWCPRLQWCKSYCHPPSHTKQSSHVDKTPSPG